ncbi:MAG: alpha/beta fold hydrolase [Sphingobacteriales bacterium]
MTNSKYLAGLIGPSLIAITVSETLNVHIWAANTAAGVHLNGGLLFVAGLSIVRSHNYWGRSWPLIITLTGWFVILTGLFRMFAPEMQLGAVKNITAVVTETMFAFATGIFLTFKGYNPVDGSTGTLKKRVFLIFLLSLFILFQSSLVFVHIQVPKTVAFDHSLPYTEINGYKYHTEIFGNPDSTPVIAVHGGPGQGYEYMKSLKELSNVYHVIFYDQKGSGLSPRVDKKYLTIEQSLEDLHSIVEHFSNGRKVKLIGHSWGGALVVGYLSKHPEMVSQAVIIEPAFLYPGAPVKEWVGNFKEILSPRDIAPYLIAYPFITKQDGDEGYDYVATKVANQGRPGPPYNCKGQGIPPNTFQRLGYEAYNSIYQPVIDNPDSFTYDFTSGISKYHGDLMLISTECSILGTKFQEKYNIPKLPSQTIHIKASNEGHNILTLNPAWSLRTIRKFFKP